MDGKQIIDILPSYISLYSNPNPNPNPNPTQDRSTILKWFTTLSPPQRVAHLTIVDPTFTQLLLRMLPLSRHSHVTFFLLPDIPSSSPRDPVPLPSLLSRSSRGLLSRLATLSPLSSSLLLFSSSSSATTSSLDTVSYRESFVANVDDFVRTMDAVSGGGFLNGPGEEWGEIGGDIVEFGWLKAKGYFTLEEFVANRVELAMRMAWLSASGGRGKRGVKVKEKEKEKARNAVGLGVNVYWRKKGCVDWWARLGSEVRRKVFRTVLGKAAKTMTGEIMKGTDGILEDNLLHFDSGAKQYSRTSYQGSSSKSTRELIQRRAEFGLSANLISSGSKRSSPLACAINRLIVLQAITAMVLASSHDDFDSEKIFFSSLDSVNTISDAILRKLRGLLMVVYLESTKFELLAEESKKIEPNKSKEKSTSIHRKKKGKTRNSKKSSTASNDCVDGLVPEKTLEDSESGSTCLRQMDGTLDEVGRVNSADKGEKVQKLATERLQTSATKKGKQHKKKKLHGRVDNSSDVCIPSPRMQMTLSSCSTAGYGKEQSTVGQSLTVLNKGPKDSAIGCHNEEQSLAPCNCEFRSKDDNLFGSEPRNLVASVKGGHDAWGDSNPSLDNKKNGEVLSKVENVDHSVDCGIASVAVTTGECPRFHEADCDKDHAVVKAGEFQGVKNHGECYKDRIASQTVATPFLYRKSLDVKKEPVLVPDSDNQARYNGPPVIPVCYPSYEWPAVAPFRLASFNSHIPPATDRLHLEVGHNWQNHFQHSLIQRMHQANPSMDGRIGRIISQPLPASLDRPPILRTCRYDSTLISRKQTTAQGFAAHSPCKSAVSNEEERKFPIDCYELSEPLSTQEFADEYDSHWVSEEECEVHAVSGIDYNQHFGGGVMYWNPSDYRGTGFSRPPSLSSDDSSWAWREADMNQTVDDMVAFSSSYSTNGLNSPSAAPFCSPFESMPPGHQPIGYVRSGNEGKMVPNSSTMMDLEVEENGPGSLASVPSDSDAKSGDSLPYPILRPIIIPNMSRERSRSEFKGNHELRSPRLPLSRRDHPRIKRPPSPVVLCVPRAPRPPPPSPVGDSKKHRGFPTVRSGSSSPRHWGVRGWFHDGANFDESRVLVEGTEVVWPSWRSTNFSAPQLVQPLPGAILQDRLIAISQLTHDQEHPDVALPLLPPELLDCSTQKASLPLIYNLLHEEIDSFCKQVAAENLIRRPYVNWAVKRVTRSLQVLWPRSRTNIFGSNASGLSLPTSDVDLVVCLPPVRNLEPIKEAGILEGRNSIKETCLQHAARYLGNQEWVKADSLKTVENTAIPIIMLVVDVPHDLVTAPAMSNGHISSSEKHKVDPGQNVDRNDVAGSDHSPSPIGSELPNRNKGSISVRLDISFKSPSHTGLQTTELVKQLTDQFPAAIPLALVLKKFLADRSLDQSYSGGLSSYCLVLLITRFLQHEHHHGRPISQNIGSLFMDFLYFFGNVFDPRQMRISIQGSGLYINRERGYSIDPIYIDDPLYPTNNVGRNCFRIHQCIKAFADAYSTLENELSCLASEGDESTTPPNQLLPKIIPSLNVSSSQVNKITEENFNVFFVQASK